MIATRKKSDRNFVQTLKIYIRYVKVNTQNETHVQIFTECNIFITCHTCHIVWAHCSHMNLK